MYRVYYLNKFVKSFTTRDLASAYILLQGIDKVQDYEILDESDDQ